VPCPICEGPAHDSGNCSCGYDFGTRDARLAYQRASDELEIAMPGVRKWLSVVGTAPVLVAFAPAYPLVWFWVLGALCVGIPPLMRLGGAQEEAAIRMKRAERLMLPPARVLR
jgi:hypothetical protein